MYSSEDLERFYFQYQTEALPHGESIQSFCVKNKVPYNIFSKWHKDTEHQICMAHAMAKLAKAETERTIRKLTTQRNNSLHYGSHEEVEMAVAYHSVISTVKLQGMSCWRYLGEFFKKIFNGCRDFFSLTPANIGMAYAKYRANEHKVKLACLYRVQPIFKD